jgi:hypothetical protein
LHHIHWRRLVTTCAIVAVAGGSLFGSTLSVAASGPTITGFSPTSGPVGTPVTITGTGFTGATSVKFKLVPASFSVPSDTEIDATVPFGASKGTISIHTPGGNVTSKNRFFKVTPAVTGFTPGAGKPGDTITINGSAFTGATQVTFNGTPAPTFTVNSYSQITATVPQNVTSGPIAVMSNWGPGASSTNFSAEFDVTDYGAHGDSSGDNTANFQSAITAAQGAGAGSTVFVPAGTYYFANATPASIQVNGSVPIVFAGAGRDSTTLVETTSGRKDLLSVRTDGTTVQDLTLDTQTFDAGHGLGVGGNHTLVQRIRVISGTHTFGIYYSGPPGAHPGNGLHSEGNVVNDLILNDQFTGDGWSFSFQDNASISNVQHTGSRITIYADTNTTITNYNYTPGTHGATAAFVMSTPCVNVTITNFTTAGEGGQIKTAPTVARINQNITINNEVMTGGPSFRLLIGDVQNLLVENSTLDEIIISPKNIAQGTVQNSTYTSVVHRPQGGATDAIQFSP